MVSLLVLIDPELEDMSGIGEKRKDEFKLFLGALSLASKVR